MLYKDYSALTKSSFLQHANSYSVGPLLYDIAYWYYKCTGRIEVSFATHKNTPYLNTLRPRQNGRHFADDTFKHIFLNQNVRNLINISLKCVPKGRIHNITSLVQIIAWHRPGDKPLSEPMMVRLPPHICVTRPQWVNSLRPSDAYICVCRLHHLWIR